MIYAFGPQPCEHCLRFCDYCTRVYRSIWGFHNAVLKSRIFGAARHFWPQSNLHSSYCSSKQYTRFHTANAINHDLSQDACFMHCRYGGEHLAPDLQKEAVYGLTEIYRDQVKSARLIANPGCYPTSVQLPLYPLLQVSSHS